MDKLIIQDLKIYCYHGLYEEEQKLGQNFYVSAELFLDTTLAATTKDLKESVNYAELCHGITDFMLHNRYDLIESVAHYLSIYILEYSSLIKEVTLRISKPEAPIGLPFQNVSVEIHRGWNQVYIAFGSNVGDSRAIIEDAIESLREHPGIRLGKISDTIITAPYGGVEQDDFYNGCVEIHTWLEPELLLSELNQIEAKAGRTREIHWGPRTLDLDILFYQDRIIHSDRLIVPHYDMANREFVLEPLAQIAPYAIHPVYKKYVAEMLKELKEQKV